MDLDAHQLAQAVLRLPMTARAELATRLLESLDVAALDEPSESVAAAWEAELDRREAALEADPSLGIPAEEAFAHLNAKLAAARTSRDASR